MAILTATQLTFLRKKLRDRYPDTVIDFTKPEINEAFQKAEDFFEANRTAYGNAVQNNTTHTWSGAELTAIIAVYLIQKAERELP